MKKKFLFMAALIMGLSMSTFVACSDDDDDDDANIQYADLDYSSEYATAWGNYMVQVAKLLQEDANSLYSAWNDGDDASYASIFKAHNSDTYGSAIECIEEILDGCIDIANEVGEAKIGEPVDYWNAGKKTAAVYAVESWYSWHSRDDYTNNIYSIRNSYYGSLDGTVAENSLASYLASMTYTASTDTKIREAIDAAAAAIQAIPQPFRNNIGSDEAVAAMDACADLVEILETTKSSLNSFASMLPDSIIDPIITNYVDVVVLPTYKSLAEKNAALYNACVTFKSNPTNNNMEAVCNAWLEARQPWETSEAFLFGPVANLGLDPNMDSWPLDQDAIVAILQSDNYSGLTWSGEYDEEDEDIEAVQSVRGFHTLEFLAFKDGEARTVE